MDRTGADLEVSGCLSAEQAIVEQLHAAPLRVYSQSIQQPVLSAIEDPWLLCGGGSV